MLIYFDHFGKNFVILCYADDLLFLKSYQHQILYSTEA